MGENNTKRLAKNTMFMYIRMAIVMLIALYSSRVLLRNLGVDDYGTYNLVGSVIGILGMFQSMFAMATQRYLNYEMGRKNNERLNLIFNMSVLINIVVSFLFVIVIELIGWWFFAYKINISPDRIFAAKVVFQLAVISSVIMIMTAPFNALIIANERMSFYALTSVLSSVINLINVLALPFLGGDNLIIYGVLMLLNQLLIRSISTVYCKKHFPESKYRRCWDKKTFFDLASFSGWQLLGTSSQTLTQNGLNMVFNIFGGPAVNAARGIAYQVSSAVGQFINNIFVSITPYSIKAHASGNKNGMFNMLFFSSKILFLISFCLGVPICYVTYPILKLWLDVVPDYTVGFVQLILVWAAFRSIHNSLDTVFKATGDIKMYQIIEGILLTLPLLFSYFILRAGLSIYFAFSTLVISEAVDMIAIVVLAKKQAGLSIKNYMRQIMIPFYVCLIVAAGGYVLIKNLTDNYLVHFLFSILVVLVLVCYIYFLVLDYKEKQYISSLVKNKIKLKK
jgi:O-antigen/teichoic acid export membrane protein